jgi:hypothetical protein
MIIFNGWKSLLAIPVLLLGAVVGLLATRGLAGGLLLGGVLVAALGFYLNRWQTHEDPATGASMRRRERQGFFWIPVQFWGLVFVALGIFALVRGI